MSHLYKIVDYRGKAHKYKTEDKFLSEWSRHRANEAIHMKLMGPDLTWPTKGYKLDSGYWVSHDPQDNLQEIKAFIARNY